MGEQQGDVVARLCETIERMAKASFDAKSSSPVAKTYPLERARQLRTHQSGQQSNKCLCKDYLDPDSRGKRKPVHGKPNR